MSKVYVLSEIQKDPVALKKLFSAIEAAGKARDASKPPAKGAAK